MANVENLKIGNNNYIIRDKNTYRSLSSTQAETLLENGTYNNEEVTSGEIFTCDDGAIKQYEDVVTYGGDKQLNFTMPYTWDITTFDFKLQNDNYGSMVYGRYYGDNTTLVIKDDVVIFDGRIGNNFISDNIKVYSMDLFNGRYKESSDGITWSSDINFNPNIYSGVVSYGGFYTLGKLVLTRNDVAYSYADTMNGVWTQGSFPTGVSNAALMPFSDELRLLDKSTGKLYSTTDLTQSWTDTGETASLPSYMSSTVWQYITIGDVVFVNQNMYGGESNNKVYCSTDKGKTYTATNLPNGEYSIIYVEKDGTFVAVRSANTSVYYTSIDGSQWSAQTPQVGTTIYGILIGGYNSAYTVSTTGASRIFTGAQHNRSLNILSSTKLSDLATAGKGIKFTGAGDANFTVVGSPTINDGILSNCSSSNYLIADYMFNPSTNDWEIGGSFTPPDSNVHYFFGTENNETKGILFGVESGEVMFAWSQDGDNWQNPLSSGVSVTAYQKYYYYAKYTETDSVNHTGTYEIGVSTDKENWTTQTASGGYIQSSSKLYIGACWDKDVDDRYLNGSMDLNDEYVKIGSDVDWTPYTVSDKPAIAVDILTPSSAPSSSLNGFAGQIAIYNGNAYICVDGSNTWKQFTS